VVSLNVVFAYLFKRPFFSPKRSHLKACNLFKIGIDCTKGFDYMVIQTNITALNAHRRYTINAVHAGRKMERLSSGFRVNRAADDAAGLAISEKMRAQIRG
jgi:flagellin